MKVPYTNFFEKNISIRNDLIDAFTQVLDNGQYISGPSLKLFESNFSKYCQTKYSTGLASGTCSLHLSLSAIGIKENDEVITVPNSFIATAASIHIAGACIVFVDSDYDMNIDVNKIEEAITKNTRVIMPVHLTGRPAKMKTINQIAKKYNLFVLEDAAQSIGAEYNNQKVGSLGDAACFSLHPLKNLHAFGDGGMMTSNNLELINKINLLKNHGLKSRDSCEFFGFNCKLDELQAALLNIQIKKIDEWTDDIRKIAFRYNDLLSPYVKVPNENPNEKHVYQTYVVQCEQRDKIQNYLQKNDVEALVHYPTPIHSHPASKILGYKNTDFPVTLDLSKKILSLPIYPGLKIEQQEYIAKLFKKFYGQ